MVWLRVSWRALLVSGIAALVVAALVGVLVLQPWASHHQPRYRHAAVAANGYECAEIGRDILLKNGSAADAAIATLFCEGVACAQCMGLGGGFLLTNYHRASGEVSVLNARETAPAATTETMFDNASSTEGGLAVAVPGELRGYGELHRLYGRLPWPELVRPTADLCRRGHRVNEYFARSLNSNRAHILAQPSLREIYVNPQTGTVWVEGDIVQRPVLARTLDIIAAEGPEALNNGSLTEAFVTDIRGFGGIITAQDLNDYRPEWQTPITVQLTDDLTLYTSPLPGSGAVLAFILNLLNGFAGNKEAPVDSNLYWHRVVEAFKYAYAKRTGLGDPARPAEGLALDIGQLEQNLTDRAWAHSYRALVDDSRTFEDWRHYGALFGSTEDSGTAHVVVVAPDGDVVSATSTINSIFGAKRRSVSTGILLNNEMDDFAIPGRESAYGMPPSPANLLRPGVRPLSSMVPSLVLDGEGLPRLAVGAAGGTKITTQVALVVMANLLEGSEFAEVVQRSRLHHQLMPMEVQHEADFDSHVMASLRALGHATTELGPTAGFAAMVGVGVDADGYLVPQTDRRRVGSAAGY